MIIRLKHVHRFADRHGNVRHYLRVPGAKSIPLPGVPGSPAFLDAYKAGLAAAMLPTPALPVAADSLDALVQSYYQSPQFRALRASTQANYRRILERLRAKHGANPWPLLNPQHVRKLVAERIEYPAAANHLLRMLRLLAAHAIQIGIRDTDPTAGIRRVRREVKGYQTWSEADIAQYEAAHPSGTKARLALALLLYTAQRRSDVVRMGRQHVRDGMIAVRQIKTGAELRLPIAAPLARELAHVPPGQLTFLARTDGASHSANGFYNVFSDWCRQAGLPSGLAPHGLRKAAARRLAEAGATTHQIAAITGHKTLSEIAVYTAAASQQMLAQQAVNLQTASRFAKYGGKKRDKSTA